MLTSAPGRNRRLTYRPSGESSAPSTTTLRLAAQRGARLPPGPPMCYMYEGRPSRTANTPLGHQPRMRRTWRRASPACRTAVHRRYRRRSPPRRAQLARGWVGGRRSRARDRVVQAYTQTPIERRMPCLGEGGGQEPQTACRRNSGVVRRPCSEVAKYHVVGRDPYGLM